MTTFWICRRLYTRLAAFLLVLLATSLTAVHASEYDFRMHRGLASQLDAAIAILSEADSHGLDSARYDIDALITARSKHSAASNNASAIGALRRQIAERLLAYALDMTIGRDAPGLKSIEALRASIETALDAGQVVAWYKDMLPKSPEYHRLRAVLGTLSESQDMPAIGPGPTLTVGDSGERVQRLRERLGIPAKAGQSTHFDQALEATVTAYQRLHGLDVDGLLGKRTRLHLDTRVTTRIQQVKANLARWRGHESTMFSGEHIRVNLPAYELTYSAPDGTSQNLRVVIGNTDNPTPSFRGDIEYMVFSPYWYVPGRIAANELLPKIRQDAAYLHRNRYEILNPANNQPLETVDWQRVHAGQQPYRIRQKPGPGNALGQVKFIFPNDYNIYVHDTPASNLFAYSRRAYSHGCIRVEHPELLAEMLLASHPTWSKDAIATAMQASSPQRVALAAPIPIAISYFTVVAHKSGAVSYYADIYEKDADMSGAMASTFLPQFESSESAAALLASSN